MAPRAEYHSPSMQFYAALLTKETNGQVGYGLIVGGLPVYAGSHGILDQNGEGFLDQWLFPALKAIGRQFLSTGSQIIADKLKNPSRKTSGIALKRGAEGAQSLVDRGYKKVSSFLQEQSGSGCSFGKRRKFSVKK